MFRWVPECKGPSEEVSLEVALERGEWSSAARLLWEAVPAVRNNQGERTESSETIGILQQRTTSPKGIFMLPIQGMRCVHTQSSASTIHTHKRVKPVPSPHLSNIGAIAITITITTTIIINYYYYYIIQLFLQDIQGITHGFPDLISLSPQHCKAENIEVLLRNAMLGKAFSPNLAWSSIPPPSPNLYPSSSQEKHSSFSLTSAAFLKEKGNVVFTIHHLEKLGNFIYVLP